MSRQQHLGWVDTDEPMTVVDLNPLGLHFTVNDNFLDELRLNKVWKQKDH